MNMAGGQLMRGTCGSEPKSAVFPSVEWFEKLAEVVLENEPAYRRLGPLDCTMVVKVDDRFFEVTFLGYGVEAVKELYELSDAAPSHFVLEGTLEAWREMLENIRANDGPDLEHTLNHLTFADEPLRLDGPDQIEIDAFYRYQESLQHFFDDTAEIDTTY